jgi:[acyl-carrier-protein] S-malonyltransferase
VVIAGHTEAVERASELCKEAGAKRALPLPVSAPFHCALMKPAADRFSSDLAEVNFSEPQIPVIQNFGLRSESNPETIRENLVSQIYNPVPWVATLKLMVEAGVSRAYEIGPGNVLSGLIKRGCPEISATPVNSPASVDEMISEQ